MASRKHWLSTSLFFVNLTHISEPKYIPSLLLFFQGNPFRREDRLSWFKRCYISRPTSVFQNLIKADVDGREHPYCLYFIDWFVSHLDYFLQIINKQTYPTQLPTPICPTTTTTPWGGLSWLGGTRTHCLSVIGPKWPRWLSWLR